MVVTYQTAKQGLQAEQTVKVGTSRLEINTDNALTGPIFHGQSSEMTIDEVMIMLEIPPATHEVATILQLGTTLELVEWLVRQLTFASNQLTQEHKDMEMIQRNS